jgi:hypothetical protein
MLGLCDRFTRVTPSSCVRIDVGVGVGGQRYPVYVRNQTSADNLVAVLREAAKAAGA